jgi:hypothetical protein
VGRLSILLRGAFVRLLPCCETSDDDDDDDEDDAHQRR